MTSRDRKLLCVAAVICIALGVVLLVVGYYKGMPSRAAKVSGFAIAFGAGVLTVAVRRR